MESENPKPSKSYPWLSIMCQYVSTNWQHNTRNKLIEERGAESWNYTEIRVLLTIPWNNYETWQSRIAAQTIILFLRKDQITKVNLIPPPKKKISKKPISEVSCSCACKSSVFENREEIWKEFVGSLLEIHVARYINASSIF